MVITLHSHTFERFALEDGNSRQMLFQVSFHFTVEISTVNLVIALKNQDQMANLVIGLKNHGSQMIQLVANQVEMTRLLDFQGNCKTSPSQARNGTTPRTAASL